MSQSICDRLAKDKNVIRATFTNEGDGCLFTVYFRSGVWPQVFVGTELVENPGKAVEFILKAARAEEKFQTDEIARSRPA